VKYLRFFIDADHIQIDESRIFDFPSTKRKGDYVWVVSVVCSHALSQQGNVRLTLNFGQLILKVFLRAERNLELFHGRQGVVRGADVDAGINIFQNIFYYVSWGGVCSTEPLGLIKVRIIIVNN
jgi:hypothetical protein